MKIELEQMFVEPFENCEGFGYDKEFYGYKVYVDGSHLMNLIQTCSGCPEQYDLKSVLDMSMLAYFKVRYGYFRVDFGDCGGETIYDFSFGNGWNGVFEDENQRIEQLSKGIEKVVEKLRKDKGEENE